MSDKKGSIFGGMLLISGSCIGAGMLGIPILTGLAGFFPSLIALFVTWAFMTSTGLLLVEANSWFDSNANILSMVGKTLGKTQRAVSWVIYLLLFYSLLVAYTVGSGNIFSTFLNTSFDLAIPDWLGSLFFVLIFGGIVYLGTRPVDLSNRLLMIGKSACYLGLIFLGFGHISFEKLMHSDLTYTAMAIPLLITSFGFHNMIPTITRYMKGDLKRVKTTVLGGSLLALCVYLIWEIIVLGIVPVDGPNGIAASLVRDQDASQTFVEYLGVSWISSFAQGFAFFAILTSFLAQSLGLVHFWEDGLDLPMTKRENPWICLLALGPPLIISVSYPKLFFQALSFAGGICAVILFGIFPVWMVWKGRYVKNKTSSYQFFGGRPILVVIFAFATFVFIYQLSSMFKKLF